jgi:peptide/nickel transport system permease protein
VEAATASGASTARNVFSHVLPNVLSPVFVQISLDLGTIMQLFAVLFFLGVISDPYFPELGNIINLGQAWLSAGIWWPVIIPGVFILLFTISINLLGDGLRDVLDPKLRR